MLDKAAEWFSALYAWVLSLPAWFQQTTELAYWQIALCYLFMFLLGMLAFATIWGLVMLPDEDKAHEREMERIETAMTAQAVRFPPKEALLKEWPGLAQKRSRAYHRGKDGRFKSKPKRKAA